MVIRAKVSNFWEAGLRWPVFRMEMRLWIKADVRVCDMDELKGA